MKRIHLLRHAKSSWKDKTLPDPQRPLKKRGLEASARMAEHVAESGLAVDLVLCSPARRARDTLTPILAALEPAPQVRSEPAVYGAGTAALLEIVKALPDDVEAVLIVGHNPGLQSFALRLAREGRDLDRLTEKYPTGALATLELDAGRWRDVAFGTARLTELVKPRELG